MKITIVSDVLGAENNGTTIATMNLARFLKENGHEVSFLCSDQDKKGVDGYYVVPNLNVGPFNNYVKKNGVSLSKPKKEIVYDAIKDADIVHIMIPLFLGIEAVKIARILNKPITAGFHMQAENFSSQVGLKNFKSFNKSVYKYIYKHVFKLIDATHFPTKFIKDIFEENINKTVNGYVISNGVNKYVKKREVKKPSEFEDKIVILSTGRYSTEKAQDVLLKAINYSKYKDKIQVILAGQGPKLEKYISLGEELPIKPIFKFYTRDEIADVINYCDLYVHPAEAELEGIACLEAICCGKLTIVSDSPYSCPKEFAVDEKCIFKMHDSIDLASKIDYFIENQDEKLRCEELYLKSKDNYNQEECMKKMEAMLLEVIKLHGEKHGKA